jgi:hypothetical protein
MRRLVIALAALAAAATAAAAQVFQTQGQLHRSTQRQRVRLRIGPLPQNRRLGSRRPSADGRCLHTQRSTPESKRTTESDIGETVARQSCCLSKAVSEHADQHITEQATPPNGDNKTGQYSRYRPDVC